MIKPETEYTWGTGRATYMIRARGTMVELLHKTSGGLVINKPLPGATLMRHLAEAEGYTGFRYVDLMEVRL